MTHTKGPWTWQAGHVVTGIDGTGSCIACIDNSYGDPEDLANIALITAAPDLLDACYRLVLAFDVGDMCHTTLNGRGYAALEEARAAIAKADPSNTAGR